MKITWGKNKPVYSNQLNSSCDENKHSLFRGSLSLHYIQGAVGMIVNHLLSLKQEKIANLMLSFFGLETFVSLYLYL